MPAPDWEGRDDRTPKAELAGLPRYAHQDAMRTKTLEPEKPSQALAPGRSTNGPIDTRIGPGPPRIATKMGPVSTLTRPRIGRRTTPHGPQLAQIPPSRPRLGVGSPRDRARSDTTSTRGLTERGRKAAHFCRGGSLLGRRKKLARPALRTSKSSIARELPPPHSDAQFLCATRLSADGVPGEVEVGRENKLPESCPSVARHASRKGYRRRASSETLSRKCLRQRCRARALPREPSLGQTSTRVTHF